MALPQLSYLAEGPPPSIAVAGMPQVGVGARIEAARGSESRSQFAGKRLVLDQAGCTRRAHGMFVEMNRGEFTPLQACKLRTDERCAGGERVRAVLRPQHEL